MRNLYLIIFFVSIAINIKAQAPDIEWQKSLGSKLPDWIEWPQSIQQTKDGGYVVVGTSNGNDGDVTGHHGGLKEDYWMIKLSGSGSLQWQKSIGGTEQDLATAIQQTMDGGYIVAGYSLSSDGDAKGKQHGGGDSWILKLDSYGTIQWQKTMGGSNEDRAYSIRQTTDSGYIIVGPTLSKDGDIKGSHGDMDCWVVKLNTNGTLQWQKPLGGKGRDEGRSICQTLDGGYIVAGLTNSNDGDVSGFHGGYNDYWIVKLNDTGMIQWQKCLGSNGDDQAHYIRQTNDGGYIIAGISDSSNGDVRGIHGSYDYWIVKIDSLGKIQWQKPYGGSSDDQAYSIDQTNEGGYVIAGYTRSTDGDIKGIPGLRNDFWIVKIDSMGIIQWEKLFGGDGADQAYSIQQTNDMGYIVAGLTNSDSGDVVGHHGSFPSHDIWVLKLGSSTGYQEIKTTFSDFQLTPNPSLGIFYLKTNSLSKNISYTVFDLVGKNIKSNTMIDQTETIDLSAYSHSIFFLQISENGIIKEVKKMITE